MDETLTQQTYQAISYPSSSEQERWGWERFDRRFRPRIHHQCRRNLVYADAEDCTAVVMEKMIVEAPEFYDKKKCHGEKNRFRKFLTEIVNNQIVDFRRANSARQQDAGELYADANGRKVRNGSVDSTGIVNEDWMDDLSTKLVLALKVLRGKRKLETVNAFLTIVTTEMTPEELAAETGFTEVNLRQIHSRCLRDLQKILTDQPEADLERQIAV